jgi:hypothetical protein
MLHQGAGRVRGNPRVRVAVDWCVPALWRSEFRHVLLKYVRSGLIDSTQAVAAVPGDHDATYLRYA